MKRQLIQFDDGEVRATLTIIKASYDIDLERQALVDEAIEATQHDPPPTTLREVYRRNARIFVLPSLLCATREATIERLVEVKSKKEKASQANADAQSSFEWQSLAWPIVFDALIGLPADLIDEWAGIVYDLNPRWDLSRKVESADVEKKASKSTSG